MTGIFVPAAAAASRGPPAPQPVVLAWKMSSSTCPPRRILICILHPSLERGKEKPCLNIYSIATDIADVSYRGEATDRNDGAASRGPFTLHRCRLFPFPFPLPPRSSFLLCRPGPINSQLIAEWHFSSSGTYTAAPPQWKWNHTAAAAAGKGRNGDGNGTSDSPAAAVAPSMPPWPPSIEAKKLLRSREPNKFQRTKS